ncbi:MAG TPA: hypothetical protein VHL57_09745, partial [Flavobacteriales bacterium]|nr:hypothetical protein [Flavobacteriales bacterium]
IAFGFALVLLLITLQFTTDSATAMMATWWVMLVPLCMKIFGKKKKPAEASAVAASTRKE